MTPDYQKSLDGLEDDLRKKSQQLLTMLSGFHRCAIAYSGGVDSAVVAKAASLVLGENCIAVTGSSHSLAEGELARAAETAAMIGIRHEVIQTQEFANEAYTRNAPDRCFHCKAELYSQLMECAPRLEVDVILNGANVDDLGDYRPGLRAAADHQVRSPLAECGFTKSDVRRLAAFWHLNVWDKPATPCLSSRVAYGQAVTPERLRMIDQAESFLRASDFPICRVRYHAGDLARIEVPKNEIHRLTSEPLHTRIVEFVTEIGFRFVTVDLGGFRSGSLNEEVVGEAGHSSPNSPQGQFVPIESIGMPDSPHSP